MPQATLQTFTAGKKVRVIHWKDAEAGPLIEVVRGAGFDVEYVPDPNGAAVARAIKASLPDAVLIDLSRLPSHGREMAVWLRNRKTTRDIPIVFVGGEEVKVAPIKAVIPDAAYVTEKGLSRALAKACAGRAFNPVVPPSAMERFKTKSAAQKLGIVTASKVAVMDAPRDYASVLGDMPENVEFFEDPQAVQSITLWFIRDAEAMLGAVRRMRAIAAQTKLWILWPKGQANKFREGPIREMGIENGMVDYKICSVNDQWSGILFARKKP
jgi:CheY-like chemotaxis protein